jgi:hypothetical protein
VLGVDAGNEMAIDVGQRVGITCRGTRCIDAGGRDASKQVDVLGIGAGNEMAVDVGQRVGIKCRGTRCIDAGGRDASKQVDVLGIGAGNEMAIDVGPRWQRMAAKQVDDLAGVSQSLSLNSTNINFSTLT